MFSKMIALLCLIVGAKAYAVTPFLPHEESRFKELERIKVRRDVLNISSTLASGATVIVGSLPTSAVVKQVVVVVETPFTSASGNTLKLGCLSTSDLLAATDFADDNANTLVAGVPVDTAASMVYVTSGCNMTATVGSGATGISAGKLIFHTVYMMGE